MNRDDYLMRATEFAARGADLPHTRLTEADVIEIRAAQEKRRDLMAHIKESLSNEAMAKKFGVHIRTIEKAVDCRSWRQAGVKSDATQASNQVNRNEILRATEPAQK